MTTTTLLPKGGNASRVDGRFRLHRAGILNVWQYDEQVFTFADGRLLLRGANGAGKSKTLEMLLPFALDGDKARITASAKHHTSLLWLMTDGVEGNNRVGYVWVEFRRLTAQGAEETFTCGVGIRASASARTATAWHFGTDRRIGTDFSLEDQAGPLSLLRLKETLGAEHVFEKAADYKAYVGRTLFGLDPAQYDEVLRLLYWLRQPQVGEDIEPVKLAQQLSQALPQLDEQAIHAAGDTFDELTAFGHQIERRAAAADALRTLADAYAAYARAVVAERARAVAEALRQERRLRGAVREARAKADALAEERAAADAGREAAETGVARDDARLRTLEDSPEFRDQRRLDELAQAARRDADSAHDAAERCERRQRSVDRLEGKVGAAADKARAGLASHGSRLRGLDVRQRRSVPGSSVPIPAATDSLATADVDKVGAIRDVLDQTQASLTQAASAVSRRQAGVTLVREAVGEVEHATAGQRAAEAEAERAEARWEDARDARLWAEQSAENEVVLFTDAATTWAGTSDAPEVPLPGEITETFVVDLPDLARRAAAPRLDERRAEQARWHSRHESAKAELDRLTADRAVVEAERDPAPPPPQLPRTDRTDGHALWQVVDFVPGLSAAERSGVEAALQAAGLLDAWVRPGGQLLGLEHRDVVLAAAGEVAGAATLADLLVADLPTGTSLTTTDVGRVLTAIGRGADPTGPAWVATDGRWRLGPAHGRAGKEQAQYIGATARAEERTRRLARLDEAIAEQKRAAEQAQEAYAAVSVSIDALDAWVRAVPSGQALMSAWTRVDERRQTEQREEQLDRAAQTAAHAARAATAEATHTLQRIAVDQQLPAERPRLDAVEQELRALADDLRDAGRADPTLRDLLERWEEAAADLVAAGEELRLERAATADAASRAEGSQAAFEALRTSVGDSVEALQRRIAEARASRAAYLQAAKVATDRVKRLIHDEGMAQGEVTNAETRLAEHEHGQRAAVTALVAATSVPGLFQAAGVDSESTRAAQSLDGHPWGEPIPRAVSAAVQALAALSNDEVSAATTRIWRAHSDAVSGPAADHQPTVAEYADLLAVTARDDAGEAVVVALADRVRAGVDGDRDLLTEREKQQFEQHVLGELGDAIRQCRRDAEELVVAMNEQLGQVTTSQGIRTRLDWRLRDDVPREARDAVTLLAQPVGALIPEERARLRDVLHRLIEASRAERPELSYGEHLAAALDYRTWSAFSIRFTRPETPGQWERLHRRSPLSQGEQKVLCYLPLFAAAAAHFTSLAGAAAHAPRLVLLDDAFPKIDVRTHPLLFGLLVQLDLDFVITSERLWGDHSTVPSLAIYEALRDPNQRGIAHYEYHWDGRSLESVG